LSCLRSCLVSSLLPHTAPSAFYTLSLHDALPILSPLFAVEPAGGFVRMTLPLSMSSLNSLTTVNLRPCLVRSFSASASGAPFKRSEEHTSELQSLAYLVCRLLLEKKKTTTTQRSS